MQFSFNSIFELRWTLCKDVFITSCLSNLPQRPQPVFLNNFSPFYYKSARTWEVLLWISFQSDLKVLIDSSKLIFPSLHVRILHSAQSCCKAGRFLQHDKNNFWFRFAEETVEERRIKAKLYRRKNRSITREMEIYAEVASLCMHISDTSRSR